MSVNWNPWHGCKKLSAGCLNCYVYRGDAARGIEERSSVPRKNRDFDLIIRKRRDGSYAVPPGELVYTCFTSDFLLDEVDGWRDECWDMMRRRNDLRYLFITKRIDRFVRCMPPDWGGGWDNVVICSTCENQETADYRLPIFINLPLKHRIIVNEPLLSAIDMRKYLGGWIEQVTVGGESGSRARVCDYRWVLDIREQCVEKGIRFYFKQTGARFLKDGRLYSIERRYQHSQARKAGINYGGDSLE